MKSLIQNVVLIAMILCVRFAAFSQEVTDSVPPIDSSLLKIAIVLPEFKLIDTDTIPLGEHDELVCDSYNAQGVPYVYDALHSFNRRRMDYFGGYLNSKINAALERVRSKGFPSDVKNLYIQIDPRTLTVYWIAVVGPSENGKCYACVDSRGSANGGLGAVNPQVSRMHRLYTTMEPELLLDFNENVIQCYEWDGTPLNLYCTYINIRQHFYKYATNCYNDSLKTVVVDIQGVDTGTGAENMDDVAMKKNAQKTSAAAYKKYKVKSGDTLSHIAQRYRTTVTALKRANNLRSDRINVGQVLKIP